MTSAMHEFAEADIMREGLSGVGKRLLVLGAGRGQVGLILAAKRLGATVIVATLDGGDLPGRVLADEVVFCDIAVTEEVESALGDMRIDGATTSCADTGVPALGQIVEARSLRGPGARASAMCAHKGMMKTAFLSGNVETPKFRILDAQDELKPTLIELGLPAIVKAVDLQGSRGISIVRSEADIGPAWLHAVADSRSGLVIVEQYIDGAEFGAQALVVDGDIQFTLVHNDEVHFGRAAVPIGHSVPFAGNQELLLKAQSQIAAAIAAVGLDNCAVNVDLIEKDGKVYVIEITGRAGANGLVEMVSSHFATDYYETIVRVALGLDTQDGLLTTGGVGGAVAVGMLIQPQTRGRIREIRFAPPPLGASLQIFAKPGDILKGFEDSSDCIGQVVATGATLGDALVLVDSVRGSFAVEVEAPG